MSVEVHVEGRILLGRMPDFMEAVGRYAEYARAHGHSVPRVLQGLSGEMNAVRLVFSYDDLNEYQRDEEVAATDRDYGEIASQMPFVDGTLAYSLYRVV